MSSSEPTERFQVEVYRLDADEMTRVSTIGLRDVLRESARRLLGRLSDRATVGLLLLNVPDDTPPPGQPAVSNLLPEYGYAELIVGEEGRVIYRHPHTVAEVIGRHLQEVLRRDSPGESHWGYCLVGPNLPRRRAARPTPPTEGAVAVAPYREGEAPPFRIRRILEPPPPRARLEDFGVPEGGRDDDRRAFAKVLLGRALFRDLTEGRPLSAEVEEGGFLVGRVFEDSQREGTFLIEVTAAPAAEYTGASLLHFTFTGDSFEAVKQRLQASHPGERLLGWYHTHLFPASAEIGLSSIDLDLHFTTFRLPWQLAGLINLDGASRTLRFYVRRDDTMVRCPQWRIDR